MESDISWMSSCLSWLSWNITNRYTNTSTYEVIFYLSDMDKNIS